MDEGLKERATSLFPNKAFYTLKEAAQIIGVSPQTVYNNREKYCFGARVTLSDIERITKRRPHRQTGKRRTRQSGYASQS